MLPVCQCPYVFQHVFIDILLFQHVFLYWIMIHVTYSKVCFSKAKKGYCRYICMSGITMKMYSILEMTIYSMFLDHQNDFKGF